AGLGDARGQDHDGALVEVDLQLETEVADRSQHGGLVRLPCRDNDATHRNGTYAPLLQCGDKGGRRWGREWRLLACRRLVKKSAVFGDDILEQIESWADFLQLIELAPGDEDEAPARGQQSLERAQCFR